MTGKIGQNPDWNGGLYPFDHVMRIRRALLCRLDFDGIFIGPFQNSLATVHRGQAFPKGVSQG